MIPKNCIWCGVAVQVGRRVFRESCERRLFLALAGITVFTVAGAVFLAGIDFGGDPRRFAMDFSFGALAVFGAILAVGLIVVSVREPWERGTLDLLLARPVGAGSVFGGLVLGAMAAVTLLLVVLGAFIALLAWLYSPAPLVGFEPLDTAFSWSGLAFAVWLSWLRLMVIAAIAALVASLVDSVAVAIVLGFLLVVVAEVQGFAREVWARSEGGWPAEFMSAVLWALPDLRLLQPAEVLQSGMVGVLSIIVLSLYAFLFAAGYLLVGAYVFRRRTL